MLPDAEPRGSQADTKGRDETFAEVTEPPFVVLPGYVQSSGSVRRLPGTADFPGVRASSPRAHSWKVNARDDFTPSEVRHAAAAVCPGEDISPA